MLKDTRIKTKNNLRKMMWNV